MLEFTVEEAILGLLFADKDNSVTKIANIKENWFFTDSNKTLLKKLKEAKNKYKVVDYEIIKEYLDYNEKMLLQEAGLKSFSLSSFNGYVSKIKERYARKTIRDNIENYHFDLSEIAKIAKEAKTQNNANLFDFKTDMEQYRKYVQDIAEGKVKRYSWGFNQMDSRFGLMREGNLITIGASTGTGKTSFCLNLCYNLMKDNHKVIYLTSEMTPHELLDRLVSLHTAIPYTKINNGYLDEMEIESVKKYSKELESKSMIFYESSKPSFEKVNQLFEDRDFDFLFLDFFQRFKMNSENTAKGYADLINEIKDIALEKRKVVVCASQLNRDVYDREDNEPKLSDLKWTSGLEEASDKVILLWEKASATENKTITLKMAKNRQGAPGNLDFTVWKDICMFDEQKGGLNV